MKTSDHMLKADFVAAYQRRIIEGQNYCKIYSEILLAIKRPFK